MQAFSPYKVAAAVCVAVVIFFELGLIVWKFSPHRPSVLIKKSSPAQSLAAAVVPMTPPVEGAPLETRSHRPLFPYVEVVNSCGPYFDGACVHMRSGPGTDYPVVGKLRNGIVLKVATTTTTDGQTWYLIGFDGVVHYPERIVGSWYVNANYVRPFLHEGPEATEAGINTTTTKRIVIDLANETLYAYDGNAIFMQQRVSTGLELTPTAIGQFWVLRKTPDSYMQGPVVGVSDQYYDLPGVPWDLYFTQDGNAIHGAYWHDHFGQPWSHGCVNLPPDQARLLYEWADLGTPVTVRN